MPETLFDAIVIGAGPTGENVADRAVKGGLTAAIVEGNLAGGECSYWACIPSKVLLRSSVALQAARRPTPGRTTAGWNGSRAPRSPWCAAMDGWRASGSSK
jgi:pyruvate/2-oxoglutarate dehydrogenase complex dihydrolipoamide dehydrogenase (E3) component